MWYHVPYATGRKARNRQVGQVASVERHMLAGEKAGFLERLRYLYPITHSHTCGLGRGWGGTLMREATKTRKPGEIF